MNYLLSTAAALRHNVLENALIRRSIAVLSLLVVAAYLGYL